MSDNYSESFEQASGKNSERGPISKEQTHGLKLSIDLLSVKNLQVAANIVLSYQLNLRDTHSFQSQPATPVGQNQQSDTELKNCFCSYDFQATKQELASILQNNALHIKVMHQIDSSSSGPFEIGKAVVELSRILSAPLKQTPQA